MATNFFDLIKRKLNPVENTCDYTQLITFNHEGREWNLYIEAWAEIKELYDPTEWDYDSGTGYTETERTFTIHNIELTYEDAEGEIHSAAPDDIALLCNQIEEYLS